MFAPRCQLLIGRHPELGELRSALASARLGHGGTHAIVGPPGIGKSRLTREITQAARDWETPVLTGRAVETGLGTAFRPLAEALLSALRKMPDPESGSLAPFRATLGRIVPHWRNTSGVQDGSLPVLGEAVLRLLGALAGRDGIVLVLEDLHWADAETLAVLEYLADNVAEEPVLMILTCRDEPGPGIAMMEALAQRHTCNPVRLTALNADEVEAMARSCLAGELPATVAAALHRRAGGVPLLVEELLAADVDPAVDVPATVTGLVTGRMRTLDHDGRRCLDAAAVLGTQFDWRIVAAMIEDGDTSPTTDTATDTVAAALRAATAAGLVVPRPEHEFRFHHALGRDAVLASVPAPEQAEWARRALAAVALAHPGLDGPWCELAADLALRAGDTPRAAAVLVEAGRRNLAGGALTSAETVLAHARALAGNGTTEDLQATELLAEVLAQAGKAGPAVTMTSELIERLRREPDSGPALVGAHLQLAGIRATAGDWRGADAELTAARTCGSGEPGGLLGRRIAGMAARVALGDSRFADAATSAGQALAGTEGPDTAVVRCDALMVLGRVARRDDLSAAERLFDQARQVAEDAGLVLDATRAFNEIVIGDVQESLRTDRLADARHRAAALGDIAATAVLDLQITAVHNVRWELEQAADAAARCVRAARRFRLATLPKALVLGAFTADHESGNAACAEALTLDPDDTHLRGEVCGIRAFRALIAVEDERARELLDDAMAAFALRPNEVTGSPAVGLWVLVHTTLDADRHDPPSTPDPITNRWNRGVVKFAEAITLGRRGDHKGARSAFTAADNTLREPVDSAWSRLQARRLVASAALADGWGDPARWAAEDLPDIENRGLERWAAALRDTIRRSGGVVPRRGATAHLPPQLRAIGVTSREAEVLVLVAQGHSNREIGERLFLSPRTVEKHVERLLMKTGVPRRAALIAYGAQLSRP